MLRLWRENDDRNFACSAFLVISKIRVFRGDKRPESLAFLWIWLAGNYRDDLLFHLYSRLWLYLKIEPPLRVFWSTTVRGNQNETVAIRGIHDRRNAFLSTLTADRCEQQHRSTRHFAAKRPSCQSIEGDMETHKETL